VSDPLDYVGECPECGSLILWVHWTLDQREIAKEIGRAIRSGYQVVRKTTEDSKAMKFGHVYGCKIDAPKRRKSTNRQIALQEPPDAG